MLSAVLLYLYYVLRKDDGDDGGSGSSSKCRGVEVACCKPKRITTN